MLEITVADAKLGRMTMPRIWSGKASEEFLYARRFAVVQNDKVRPIDDETGCGLNGCCKPCEKYNNESLDQFMCLIESFFAESGSVPHVWKADIDAAYRRVPVRDEDRWATGTAFKHGDSIWLAEHLATPFGSIGSVYAWYRIGACIATLARRTLHIPVLRYVDDSFSVDWPEAANHALHCFRRFPSSMFNPACLCMCLSYRLVAAILGESAMVDRKMECAASLLVLGVRVHPSAVGVRLELDQSKRLKYLDLVREALRTGKISMGAASKLAGKLSFTCCWCFNRLGRAMMKPIFAHSHVPSRGNAIRPRLRLALQWWEVMLQQCVAEEYRFGSQGRPWFDLFCDARGSPPRLAAVLVDPNGKHAYTDCQPDRELVELYTEHGAWDNNITNLELLAIVLGMSTFAHRLAGQNVRIWSDNTGSEWITRKGAAKNENANKAVHALWSLAALKHIGVWVDRVPTDANIADGPSREKYEVLEDVLQAEWVTPIILDSFYTPDCWYEIPEIMGSAC